MKAYRDTWGGGVGSSLSQYLGWFYETAVFLHELLRETGSLYVHLDSTVSHYAKTILDGIFGKCNFRNGIVWQYKYGGRSKSSFGRKHDYILYYVRTPSAPFFEKSVRVPHEAASLQLNFRKIDEHGRRYREGKWKSGKVYRYYADEGRLCDDVWNDINSIHQADKERLNYPTQKPEALLERIIRASSNEGDLVLDCFCGSGTTPAVAEKLKRRWIACDLGRFAIHTSRKRLLGIENVRPFVVQNLGKYERQVWQKAEFGQDAPAKSAPIASSSCSCITPNTWTDSSGCTGAKAGGWFMLARWTAP